MNLAFSLLLCAAAPAAPPANNLDLRSGTLAGWEGDGFYVTTGTGTGPGLELGVSSSDRETRGRTGVIHHTFEVPEGAGVIRFLAYAARGKEAEPDENLDIALLAPGRRVLPKQVRTAGGWKPARLLPPDRGRPREYIWDVSAYGGQTLRVVIADEDRRPNCHVFAGGFRIVPADEWDSREFGLHMLRLTREHRLPPVARYESKHFIALSNADDAFTETRLNNCEMFYDIYYDFFRRKGFRLRQPPGKMMLAIFDSQAGFEAYLGHRLPPTVTGIYHPGTNRLLVYDYGTNNAFVAQKRAGELAARRIGTDLERRRFIETVNREAREFRTEANIGTIMHEVAHQLSFNSGLLNREGDVAFWLAEGFACYCEATQHGAWQGIGEMNPERLAVLVGPAHGHGRLIPLFDLITRDDWSSGKEAAVTLLAYAQSWALFRMLMDERTPEMRRYLATIYHRRTGEHRLGDFTQAFGTDLPRLELRYGEYVKELVHKNHRPRR